MSTTDITTAEQTTHTAQTTHINAQPESAPRGDVGRVPFSRLVNVELRKLVDTRAGTWLLIAIGLITAAIVVVMLFTASRDDLTFKNLTLATAIPQGLLLPILGVLAVTSEWSQRTGLVTFTLEPRRARVAAAKLAAAVLVGLASVTAAFAFGAVANLLGMALKDGNGSWELGGAVLAGAVLLQVIGVVQGVAFGMAILSSAAAIVTFLVLPTAWTILGSMIESLRSAAEWLDLAVTGAPLLEGQMSGGDWARLGTSTVVWVVLPLAFGLYRLVRREVK